MRQAARSSGDQPGEGVEDQGRDGRCRAVDLTGFVSRGDVRSLASPAPACALRSLLGDRQLPKSRWQGEAGMGSLVKASRPRGKIGGSISCLKRLQPMLALGYLPANAQ